MRVKAISSISYMPYIPSVSVESLIQAELRYMRLEQKRIERRNTTRKKYIEFANRMAMEMEGQDSFYDVNGVGHRYEYYNFSALV